MAQRTQRRSAQQATSPTEGPLDRAFLWVAGAAVVGAVAIFWRPAVDPYTSLKLGWVTACALTMLALTAAGGLLGGRLAYRRAAPLVGYAAFLALALVATLASPHPWRSFIGQRGRATGSATYLVLGLVLALLAARLDEGAVRRLLAVVAWTGVGLAAYGLLQRLGLDPIDQGSSFGAHAVIGTIGNTNFLSGVLAIALPLIVWQALERAGRQRILGLAAAALVVVVILAAGAVQGVLAGAVGVAVVAAGERHRLPGTWRRPALLVVSLLAVVVVTVLGAGFADRGPVASVLNDSGRTQRVDFWRASVDMLGDHPLTGVGFDRFGSYYRAYRSEGAALSLGAGDTADEPHNVPLGMFVSGGPALGLAYLGFVLLTGWALLRGLRRSEGGGHRLLLAVGGAWLAYQVQSVVSIDSPPLPVLHVVLAACIVALVVPISWLGRPATSRASRRRRQEGMTGGQLAGVSAVVAVWLVLLWVTSAPVRAELLAARAKHQASSGDGAAAAATMADAHRALPHEPTYEGEEGRIILASERPTDALPLYEEAARRESRSLTFVLPYARLLDATGKAQDARRWYRRALEVEPLAPDIKVEVARFELKQGRTQVALRLALRARAQRAADVTTDLVLGDCYRVLRQYEESDAAFERVLAARSTDVGLRLRLVKVASDDHRPDRAIALLRETIEVAPRSADVWFQLGSALLAQGDRAGAVDAYTKSATFDPSDTRPRDALEALGAPLPAP